MDNSTKYAPAGAKVYWLPDPALLSEESRRRVAVGGPGYVAFRLHSVQVLLPQRLRDAFTTPPQAVLTSSVQMKHPALGSLDSHAIRWVQQIQRDRANRLGLKLGLVDWIPAIFQQARLSIEVTLSSSNRLEPLIALTKDDDLATVLSFAPGVAPAVRLLGTITDRLLSVFVEDDDAQTPLKFTIDVPPPDPADLSAGKVSSGYWVILSPVGAPSWPKQSDLSVVDGDLMISGKSANNFSYAIIERKWSPVRGEPAGYGQPWYDQLESTRQTVLEQSGQRTTISQAKKKRLWKQVQAELRDVSVLLRADRQYTMEEKLWIVSKAMQEGYEKLGLDTAVPPRQRTEVAAQPLPSLTDGSHAAADGGSLMSRLVNTPTPTPEAGTSAGEIVALFGLPSKDRAAAIRAPLVQAAEQFPTWLASEFTGREYASNDYTTFSVVSTKKRSLSPGEGYILASGIRAYEQETLTAKPMLQSFASSRRVSQAH
jgi:hypothetical protein